MIKMLIFGSHSGVVRYGSEHSAGVSCLKNNFAGDVLHTYCDEYGHFILLILKCYNINLIVVNYYGYNSRSENDQLLFVLEDKLTYWQSKFPNAYLVIGGDFNTVLNESLDRWPPGRRSNSNTALKDFMHRLELVDIWRVKNTNDQEFTWSNKKLSSLSRIDFWLVSRNLDKDYIHVDISTTPLTDHKAVSIKIMFSPEARFNKGSSYWKINSSLLKHNEVKSELERLIRFYCNKAKREDSFGLNWELLKYEIGKYLRKCSGNLAKLKCLEEANIVREISFITKILPENLSDSQRTCLVDLQIKLDDLYKLRAEGAFVRSRQRWLEHGEQMSSYFFKLGVVRSYFGMPVEDPIQRDCRIL